MKERREVRRRAPDQRPAGLGDGAAELGVDVFVCEVDRRRAEPARDRTEEKARRHDSREHVNGAELGADRTGA
jgi:hypothetical protein